MTMRTCDIEYGRKKTSSWKCDQEGLLFTHGVGIEFTGTPRGFGQRGDTRAHCWDPLKLVDACVLGMIDSGTKV